jgi:hypothetical protein
MEAPLARGCLISGSHQAIATFRLALGSEGDAAERKGRMENGLSFLLTINGAARNSPTWRVTAEFKG